MRPIRPARSLGLALVAGVCLLSQLGGYTHLVLVRHQTCLEHASLEHGEGVPVPAGLDVAQRPTRKARLGDQPAAQHADDHCLVVALRKRDVLGAPPANTACLPRPETERTPLAVTARTGAPPVPLLRLAPKVSPPSAAV